MRLKNIIVAFVGLAIATWFFGCSKPTDNDHAGDGSQTGNAAVVGKLYLPDGHTPAAHATLHLRKKSTLADTSGASLPKVLADTTATVTTNDTGGFAIDSINPGLYVIEGAKDSDVVLIDSVRVQSLDSTVTLPPDTLKPAGALKGLIYLSEGGDPRKVFILAFGIDRFAGVNADGSFKFSNLAEGKYDLRLISSLDNYGVLDTFGIPIISADTTNMDTIRLPFTGIPTPKNVSINYDVFRQIATLSWSKADSNLVKGYNVYRRNVDSNTVLARINSNPITDTLYRDSSGHQDMTYEYKVVAVSPNDMEGTKSLGVNIKFIGAFQLVDSIPLQFTNGLTAIDLTPTGQIIGIRDSLVKSYDIASKAVNNTWSIPESIGVFKEIAYINDSTLIAAGQKKLVAFSTNRGVTNTWDFDENISGIAVVDTLTYFIKGTSTGTYPNRNYKICRLNLSANFIDTIFSLSDKLLQLSPDEIQNLDATANFLVFTVRHYTNSGANCLSAVFKYSLSDGSINQLIEIPWGVNQNPDFAIVNDTIIMSTDLTCRIITDELLASWAIPEYSHQVAAQDMQTIYIGGAYNKIYIYKRR